MGFAIHGEKVRSVGIHRGPLGAFCHRDRRCDLVKCPRRGTGNLITGDAGAGSNVNQIGVHRHDHDRRNLTYRGERPQKGERTGIDAKCRDAAAEASGGAKFGIRQIGQALARYQREILGTGRSNSGAGSGAVRI